MDGSTVLRATGECHGFLTTAVDRDWTAPAPGMDWTVAETVSTPGTGRTLGWVDPLREEHPSVP